MINEKGFSWPESILALVVLTVIFGTLLPFYSNMANGLERKRLDMHATKTAYHGAVLHHYYGRTSGIVSIEKVHFNWSIELNAVCVSYQLLEEDQEKCINY